MKIAMIGHKRIPSREGGVEIVVEELSRRMVEKGHEVVAYNRKGKHIAGIESADEKKERTSDYKGIHIVVVPTFERKSLNAIVYAFSATCKAIRGNYDVIHYHAEGPCAMIPMAKIFTKAKCVATIHGLDWQRAKWGGIATKVLLFGEKMAAKYADEVIVLSQNVQEYFAQRYNRSCVYIQNGVSIPEIMQPSIIKKKYGLEGDDYILFLARIVPEKGLHYLVEAYQRLAVTQKLVIAGSGSHTDSYVSDVSKMINQNPNIILTGFVEGRELEELYSNCCLYVLPSDIEGMPLSLLEALSYGRQCLVSDIPENREVCGAMAEYFLKSDIDDLARKLSNQLEQKITEQQREQIRENIRRRFDWNEVAEETLNLYKRARNKGDKKQ